MKTLRFIAKLDVRIRYVYLRRENILESYKSKDKLESRLLYTSVIGESLEMYLPPDENQFLVYCDHRHLKSMTGKEFHRVLEAGISNKV